MVKLSHLLVLFVLGVAMLGCGSSSDEDAPIDKGPVVSEDQRGMAGGKGNGEGQKGDFKPLPPN